MKNYILKTLCAAALLSFVACSEDSDPSPVAPESSADVSLSSGGETPVAGSSAAVNGSSAVVPAITSSSSYDDGVDGVNPVVQITEIMYRMDSTFANLQWVEVHLKSGGNRKTRNMGMDTLRLEAPIPFTFPADDWSEGDYVVVTNDVDMFKQAYPTFTGKVYGPWGIDPKTGVLGKLVKEGDVIELKIKGEGDFDAAYSNEPPWTSRADGKGFSLSYMGGNGTQASSWTASGTKYGTPGAANDFTAPTFVRINEIMPFSISADSWVELYNSGDADVNVTDWIIKNVVRDSNYTISGPNAPYVVPAKGYLVLNCGEGGDFDRVLVISDLGGAFYLREFVGDEKSGTESSILVAASKLSSGVVDVSDGSIAQGALQTPTPGAANAPLHVGSVIINEIYYHEPDVITSDMVGAIPFEFLELKNVSEVDVKLFATVNGSSRGWKIEGVNKEFGATDVIPAGGMMVLVRDSILDLLTEAKIRADYSIPDAVKISAYKGKLSNRGEMIAIKQPYAQDAKAQWYYDWSDATLYSDRWEGLKEADGLGKSLNRVEPSTMGYESKAWVAAAPTPGK